MSCKAGLSRSISLLENESFGLANARLGPAVVEKHGEKIKKGWLKTHGSVCYAQCLCRPAVCNASPKENTCEARNTTLKPAHAER